MVSWSISYLPKLLVGQRTIDHSSDVRIQKFLAAVGVSILRMTLCRINRVIAAKPKPQCAMTGHSMCLCKRIQALEVFLAEIRLMKKCPWQLQADLHFPEMAIGAPGLQQSAFRVFIKPDSAPSLLLKTKGVA